MTEEQGGPARRRDMRGPRVGVGAVVVREGALLMVRRAKDPGRGLWSLPGGHVEHGEYLSEAVRREIAEETGLTVRVEGLAGIFEVLGREHLVILDFVAEVEGDSTPRPGGDAGEVAWVPLDEVERRDCTPRFVETLRGWGVLPPSAAP